MTRPLTFDRFTEEVATKRGGYTLWLGAGVAKALCPAIPTWKELENALASGLTAKPPQDWDHRETPARLDWIAGKLGHQAFRRTLREKIVEPMKTGTIDGDIADAMAIVGARAASLVCFNIESVSSLPFIAAHGGDALTIRPYLRPHNHVVKTETSPGSVMPPIFFAHGLLDISGDCVMTESEYKIHGMSLAVNTAVSLCLGGDLLILGMSLGDRYLRDAILQQRRWFRQVFWVSRDFEHLEWARAAGVHCIEVDYSRLWSGISEAIVNAAPQSQLAQWWGGPLRGRAKQLIDAYRSVIVDHEAKLMTEGDKLAARVGVRAKELVHYARHCVDFGLEIPPSIVAHPEWTGAIDWKEDDIA